MTIERKYDHERLLWFLDTRARLLVTKESNEDDISLIEHKLPFDFASPLHMHNDEDELFYILDGEVLFKVGTESRVLGPGEALVAPRRQPHGFRVVCRDGASLLTITRGGFEAAVRAVSRPAQGDTLPEPIEPSPEMEAALGAVFAGHGISLLGPPISDR